MDILIQYIKLIKIQNIKVMEALEASFKNPNMEEDEEEDDSPKRPKIKFPQPPSCVEAKMEDAYTGCILGAFVGDSLGSYLEF